MKTNYPHLCIEINEKKIIFLVVKYNEELQFTALESKIINSVGFSNGKIFDINILSKTIKDTLDVIEETVGYTFKYVTVVTDQNNINCINVSGYKKLNGSQILAQDVSYILNDIKKIITDKETKYSLIHLFNSAYTLDGENIESMPIGLHGEFYNHHLTCFLTLKNDIRNLKKVLNNCHLNIRKIVLRPFALNMKRLKKNYLNKAECFVHLGKKKSDISIFKNSSFIYHEKFNFGTDIIIKDISKVCSLKFNEAENILKKIDLNNINIEKEYLEKVYFTDSSFRKISLKHIESIIIARVEEIIELIYKKNVNLSLIIKDEHRMCISLEENHILNNIKKLIRKILEHSVELHFYEDSEKDLIIPCLSAAELTGRGWKTEAIPIIQTKKSLITRIFSSLFQH